MQSDDWIVRLLDEDVKRTQLEQRKRRIIGWSTVALIAFCSWLGMDWWLMLLVVCTVNPIAQLMAGLTINWW